MVKLLFSSAWNACFFLIVFIFNVIVGAGIIALKGDTTLMCSYEMPTVTRLIPILVFYPYSGFSVRVLSEGFAAVLALWAMLPSFQHELSVAAGMK
jgi:hypothetical protein